MKFSILVNMERFEPGKSYTELLDELVDLVQTAERGGFETVWVAEHHTIEFTISPNPLNLLTHLAGKTSRIRLGTGVATAPYWHPIRLAGEAALTDLISGGRLELGLARGAYQYEFDRMANGLPQEQGGRYLRELVPALKGLWRGDYAHEGECYRFPAATSVPKPLQTPNPPLWIAARDADTHDFAVRNGCNVMATPLSKPDSEVESLVEKFDGAVRNNPDVPRPRLMMLRQTFVCDGPDDWELPVRALIDYGRHFSPLFGNIGKVENGFAEPVPMEATVGKEQYQPETIRGNQMIGTSEEIIPRLKHYEALGIDQFAYWADNGLPHEHKKRSLERFCREVMPAFR